MRKRRALFGNAAFEVIAGSELVILEIVEYLVSIGWECDITGWYIADPMRQLAIRAGAKVLPTPTTVRPLDYDIVWLQNRLETIFDYSESDNEAGQTLFAFAHLDQTWSLAQPGVLLEPLLGGVFVVTSERAVDHVVKRGLPRANVRMIRNAAPRAFLRSIGDGRRYLERLFIVSNHLPPELAEAASILRENDIEVVHYGSGGDVQGRRLSPSDLEGADAIVTIGKTVSYALCARVPVYIYDHFGGPGWLRDTNVESAKEANFSGRCCERHLNGETIASEIIGEFAAAARESAARSDDALADFKLEPFIDGILGLVAAAPTPAEHRAAMERDSVRITAERELATAAGHYFKSTLWTNRKAQALKAEEAEVAAMLADA